MDITYSNMPAGTALQVSIKTFIHEDGRPELHSLSWVSQKEFHHDQVFTQRILRYKLFRPPDLPVKVWADFMTQCCYQRS